MQPVAVPLKARIDRVERGALFVGLGAFLVCVIGALANPVAFFRAYLAAYLFVLGIAHGCFAVLMIYHLTGGAWGFLIRRVLEAGTRTMPLLAGLFLPVALRPGSPFLLAPPGAGATQPGPPPPA